MRTPSAYSKTPLCPHTAHLVNGLTTPGHQLQTTLTRQQSPVATSPRTASIKRGNGTARMVNMGAIFAHIVTCTEQTCQGKLHAHMLKGFTWRLPLRRRSR